MNYIAFGVTLWNHAHRNGLLFRSEKMDLEHTTRTSSIGESMNSSLKGHSKKNLGCMTIGNASENMVQHSKSLDKKRNKYNAMCPYICCITTDISSNVPSTLVQGVQLASLCHKR